MKFSRSFKLPFKRIEQILRIAVLHDFLVDATPLLIHLNPSFLNLVVVLGKLGVEEVELTAVIINLSPEFIKVSPEIILCSAQSP